MKKTYTTAMGRSIDFESLRAANEETIAVGNMKVNARGDQLGSGGVIERPRNAAMADHYNAGTMPHEGLEDKMLRQKMAGAGLKKNKASKKIRDNTRSQDMSEKNRTNESLDQAQSVPTQQPEVPPASSSVLPDKRLRGSLASSLAKETTVTQEKMPDPRKPKSISRI